MVSDFWTPPYTYFLKCFKLAKGAECTVPLFGCFDQWWVQEERKSKIKYDPRERLWSDWAAPPSINVYKWMGVNKVTKLHHTMLSLQMSWHHITSTPPIKFDEMEQSGSSSVLCVVSSVHRIKGALEWLLWLYSPVMCNVGGGEQGWREDGDGWMEVRAEWSDTKVFTLRLFLLSV